MKRPVRNEDGFYHIHGTNYKHLFGSRQQVWGQSAYKTTGLLTKKDLHQNKHGRIVSKKKFYTAKKEKRLEKNGYFTEKGKFGYVRKTYKKGMTDSAATDDVSSAQSLKYKCRGVRPKSCKQDPNCTLTKGKKRKSHCRTKINRHKK
jgi:hypothetical protein